MNPLGSFMTANPLVRFERGQILRKSNLNSTEALFLLPVKDAVRFSGKDFPDARLGLTVTAGTQRDIDAIKSLSRKIEEEEFGRVCSEEEYQAETDFLNKQFDESGAYFHVIKDKEGRLVGSAALLRTEIITYGVIGHVYLVPEIRGRGIGQWLVEDLIERAEKIPEFTEVVLGAHNPAAISLYSKLGFARYKEDDKGNTFMFLRIREPWSLRKVIKRSLVEEIKKLLRLDSNQQPSD